MDRGQLRPTDKVEWVIYVRQGGEYVLPGRPLLHFKMLEDAVKYGWSRYGSAWGITLKFWCVPWLYRRWYVQKARWWR